MAQQKLYTEEQVVSMLDRARMHKQDDTEMFTNEYLLSQETPIELPSDEEIKEAAPYVPENASMDFWANQEGFIDGAKWMKEQILNENKFYRWC